VKTHRCLGLALALVLIAPAAALADAAPDPSEQLEPAADRSPSYGIVRLDLKREYRPSPVPLPMPVEPDPDPRSVGSTSSPDFGSALVGARGSAASTPQQQAEREIRRLIRKLG